jgi:hypothetical protein
MRTIDLGDSDPNSGQTDSEAWQSFGFDIDGASSSCASGPFCQPQAQARVGDLGDGQGGIDNSFGRNIVPMLTAFTPTPTKEASASIAAGLTTNLIAIRGFGIGQNASGMSASMVVAGPLGSTPTWSTSDAWPVDSSSLRGGNIDAPLLSFPASYLTQRVLVAAPASGEGEISLGILASVPFLLPIRHVQIAMTVSADGSTATGTVSGILLVEGLLRAASAVVAAKLATYCSSGGIDSTDAEIVDAADIPLDGTADTTQQCAGISFGIGFTAVRAQLGPVVDVAPPPTCPDGGGPAGDAGGG